MCACGVEPAWDKRSEFSWDSHGGEKLGASGSEWPRLGSGLTGWHGARRSVSVSAAPVHGVLGVHPEGDTGMEVAAPKQHTRAFQRPGLPFQSSQALLH